MFNVEIFVLLNLCIISLAYFWPVICSTCSYQCNVPCRIFLQLIYLEKNLLFYVPVYWYSTAYIIFKQMGLYLGITAHSQTKTTMTGWGLLMVELAPLVYITASKRGWTPSEESQCSVRSRWDEIFYTCCKSIFVALHLIGIGKYLRKASYIFINAWAVSQRQILLDCDLNVCTLTIPGDFGEGAKWHWCPF